MKKSHYFAYCLMCLLLYQCKNANKINILSSRYGYSIDYKTIQSPNTVAQTLGINTIWGWGHPQGNSDTTKGAHFFCQLTPNIRSYHEWNWDTPTPKTMPNYTQMAQGNGTEAQTWLNWDTEYALWKKTGANIQVSIKFDNQTQPLWMWDNPYQNAYNYGYAFAKHFGKMHGNGLVDAIEIGNEPWNYPSIFYQNILNGMANGIHNADSTLAILPCALQCNNPNAENTELKNYAPTRLTPQSITKLSGFNGHYYSYGIDAKEQQVALPPEHPNSTFRAILADLHFRDTHLPKKAFYVTEFGWDSSSANETCTHPQCVVEEQQAAYAIRAFLMLMRLGVDKAYWYFYANTDNIKSSKLYARSGLTESINNNFMPKKSFVALQQLIKIIGHTYFISTVQENEQAYIYAFGSSPQNITHWVMWQPNNENTTIDLSKIPHLPKKNYHIWQLNNDTKQYIAPNAITNTKITLGEMPIVLE